MSRPVDTTYQRRRARGDRHASGPTTPEEERSTVQVLLRMTPEQRKELDALARKLGLTRSACVVRLVERAT